MTTTAKRDNVLRKVRALMDQAEHANTSPVEAATFRAKAESLMQVYRIEETEAVDRGEAPSLVPVCETISIVRNNSQFRDAYFGIALDLIAHCGLKGNFKYASDENGAWNLVAEVVGYESDIRFFEMLFTNVRLAFSNRMEPAYDPAESDQDNVYRMRNAGMTRGAISVAMGWLNGSNGKALTASAAADKASRLYGAACREHGSEPLLVGQGINMKVYVKQYVDAFRTELYWRLKAAVNGADSVRGAVVLASRKERVQDAFYEMFPHMRPVPAKTSDELAESDKPETDAQKARRIAKSDREYEERVAKRSSVAGRAGTAAGTAAAKTVDLHGATPAQRLS